MGMNRGNNREIIFKDGEHEMFYRSCLPKYTSFISTKVVSAYSLIKGWYL